MPESTNVLYLELQAISRLLHNVLLNYPSEDSIQYFIDNKLNLTWPALQGSEVNKQGKSLLNQFLLQWHPEKINDIKLDYGQLYFGPGEPKAMPWGSVYLCDQQQVNDESTLKLMDFYKQKNISFELEYNQPQDHIALFYAVIDQLLELHLAEPENAHVSETLIILLQQHMLPWSGRCHELAIKHAETDFYKGIALLASDFENVLAKTLNIIPMPMRLFR